MGGRPYAENANVPDVVTTPSGGPVYRLIKDHLGSVRLVVRQSDGAILRRLDFDAYGRKLATSSGTMDIVPFGFAGGLWDPDTGLVRFGARDYDPETGRWLTKDPSRFGGGTNFYEYAGGDPVNRIDPTGNSWLVVVGLGLLWLDLALTVESHDDPDLLIAAAGAGVGEAAGAAFKVARAAYAARGAARLCESAAIRSIDDVLRSPGSLSGLRPDDLLKQLDRVPSGWRSETLGRGAHKGQGWVLREYTERGSPTGRMLRWHPGGGHHGADPYWRVIDYSTKSDIIR